MNYARVVIRGILFPFAFLRWIYRFMRWKWEKSKQWEDKVFWTFLVLIYGIIIGVAPFLSMLLSGIEHLIIGGACISLFSSVGFMVTFCAQLGYGNDDEKSLWDLYR